MKRSVRFARIPVVLPDSVHRRLNMYACTAAAAGVGVLTLTAPAEARIIFTHAHRTIRTNQTLHLDLNHDRMSDFLISNRSFCTSDVCGRTLRAFPIGTKNRIVGAKGIGGPYYAYALNRGVKIGPRQPFSGKLMAASGSEYGSVGQWFNVSDRYLGLKFFVKGKLHYGWARFSVIVGGQTITAALTGFAYETIPNKPIVAGRTRNAEPESAAGLPARHAGSLGVLALGMAGRTAGAMQ